MSREAWGDEGNVATHWDQTLLATELAKVVERFDKWRRDYHDEMPSTDFQDAVAHISEAFDALQETLTGRI